MMKDQIKKTLKAQGWKVKTVGCFVVATSSGKDGGLWMSTVCADTLTTMVCLLDSKGVPLDKPHVFKFSFPAKGE
tara:strand:+ start:2403 stop:2627 length:225 start_codon:yes stop_codon:yes gene_type:complete